MINLLPQKDKEIVIKEKVRRFIIVAGIMVSFALFFGLVLLSPSYFYLLFEKKEFERTLEFSNSAENFKNALPFEKDAEILSKKLSAFVGASAKRSFPSLAIERILKTLPPAVKLKSVSYIAQQDGTIISLSGNAGTRDDLLNFKKALEKTGMFKKVNSPVSNYLQGIDIEFSLALEAK